MTLSTRITRTVCATTATILNFVRLIKHIMHTANLGASILLQHTTYMHELAVRKHQTQRAKSNHS